MEGANTEFERRMSKPDECLGEDESLSSRKVGSPLISEARKSGNDGGAIVVRPPFASPIVEQTLKPCFQHRKERRWVSARRTPTYHHSGWCRPCIYPPVAEDSCRKGL